MTDAFEKRIVKTLRRLQAYDNVDYSRMSVVQAAAYCSVSLETIRSGKLEATKVGTAYRVSRSAIDDWMKSLEMSREGPPGQAIDPRTGLIP
jgi:excisionase family DNA binding protein